jgi:hypothetical protein
MIPLFWWLSRSNVLRVPDSVQALGLDVALHGGPAYIDWDVEAHSAGNTKSTVAPAEIPDKKPSSSHGV